MKPKLDAPSTMPSEFCYLRSLPLDCIQSAQLHTPPSHNVLLWNDSRSMFCDSHHSNWPLRFFIASLIFPQITHLKHGNLLPRSEHFGTYKMEGRDCHPNCASHLQCWWKGSRVTEKGQHCEFQAKWVCWALKKINALIEEPSSKFSARQAADLQRSGSK